MFTRSARLSLLIVLLLCFSIPSFAWDEAGHKVVAMIAWQQMRPDVRTRVFKTLMAAPEDSQIPTFYMAYGSKGEEARMREFFVLMSTWADMIKERSLTTRYTKYNNSNWHYEDTFWTDQKGKVELVTLTEPGGLAMQKLNDLNAVIRSGSATEADKAIAVAWLIHLVGDIHQPLHASSRVTTANPKGDQGGNLVLLTPKGTPRDKQVNLHFFWDSILEQNSPNSKDLCDADYLDPIARDIMAAFPYDKVKDRLQPGKFDIWKNESFELATTEVYKGIDWFKMPSDKYKEKAFKIAQERMALAGYRLADLFNEVFAAPPAPAPKPTPAAQ